MSERQIELTWKCSSCGHENLGRHTICAGCGSPKDGSEEYEMPADPSQVASVTDPALLRLATAGENWSCAYCGSDQRALDGSCERCGAGRKEGANRAKPAAASAEPARARFPRIPRAAGFVVLGAMLFAGTCALVSAKRESRYERVAPPVVTAAPPPPPPPPPRTEFTGTVTSVAWSRTVTIETWQRAPHEGFAADVPSGALAVTPAGQHVHHTEEVLDHDETEYDDVEVPDGYRTETYAERVSCGQDCTTSPRVCRNVCSSTPRNCTQSCRSNKNGFATCTTNCTGGTQSCHDECSGGTSTCTTRYCSETRTRQIPKTRHEKRPRIVHKYRSEPRYAPWVKYETFEWVSGAHASASGADVSPEWPDAGALTERDADAPRPGDKRLVRAETLSATITTDDGATHAYTPADATELARLAAGSTHKVRIEAGHMTILD